LTFVLDGNNNLNNNFENKLYAGTETLKQIAGFIIENLESQCNGHSKKIIMAKVSKKFEKVGQILL
jgi:hypothetical protein